LFRDNNLVLDLAIPEVHAADALMTGSLSETDENGKQSQDNRESRFSTDLATK